LDDNALNTSSVELHVVAALQEERAGSREEEEHVPLLILLVATANMLLWAVCFVIVGSKMKNGNSIKSIHAETTSDKTITRELESYGKNTRNEWQRGIAFSRHESNSDDALLTCVLLAFFLAVVLYFASGQ
jgi:hypothetical protein